MAGPIDTEAQIARTSALLREKLGARGGSLEKALGKARNRLPRRIYKQGLLLAKAQGTAHHPKLRLTLDHASIDKAAREVQAHLSAIDLADRRKGWVLGMLGGLSFNLILAVALLIAFLMWRGFL